VWLNIVTHQGGAVDGVEVVLIHGGSAGGAEAYRNAAGQTVYYDPGTAVPVGYPLPAALAPKNTTVVLQPAINGVGAIANSGLFNLSVAASSWTLRIPAIPGATWTIARSRTSRSSWTPPVGRCRAWKRRPCTMRAACKPAWRWSRWRSNLSPSRPTSRRQPG